MFDLLLASDFRGDLQDALVVILCGVALFCGSTPERAAIAVWVFCFELPSLIYRDWLGLSVTLNEFDFFLASKDVVAGACWIALALYANRNYTLWIAGIQLLAIGSHVARGLVESISPIGFVSLVVAPGWMVLIIMSIGFTRHILRKREFGTYRDWRIVQKTVPSPPLKPGSLS